jgi:hypothetical protein
MTRLERGGRSSFWQSVLNADIVENEELEKDPMLSLSIISEVLCGTLIPIALR